MAAGPDISVVVPSHDRPLRLRWLLNALEEQTLTRDRWEVVVAHDSSGSETDDLLESHPLARAGLLRPVRRPVSSSPPGANRNAGWRAAQADVIAFIDDDCRPSADWLERAWEAAGRAPRAILQGTTRPDPDERTQLNAHFFHTQYITPPQPFAQACNIVYPRTVLEVLDGFDERLLTGEDMDLAARARARGVAYRAAPAVLAYHAVVPQSLRGRIRSTWRWGDLVAVLARHPRLRRHFPLGLFWRRSHVRLLAAAFGLAAVRAGAGRSWVLLALPYAWVALTRHGTAPRKVLRGALELPTDALADLAEVAALLRGSVRHRTVFL